MEFLCGASHLFAVHFFFFVLDPTVQVRASRLTYFTSLDWYVQNLVSQPSSQPTSQPSQTDNLPSSQPPTSQPSSQPTRVSLNMHWTLDDNTNTISYSSLHSFLHSHRIQLRSQHQSLQSICWPASLPSLLQVIKNQHQSLRWQRVSQTHLC